MRTLTNIARTASRRDKPTIPGLAFRKYRGEADIHAMVECENACWKADLIDVVITEDEMAEELKNPINMDPFEDIVIAEVEGEYAGHSMVRWQRKPDRKRFYDLYSFVSAKWRGKGLREQLVRRTEERLREIADKHPKEVPKFFESYVNARPNDWKEVLEREGYNARWHLFEMVRPNLDDIPDRRLPAGVEVRPVLPEHHRPIWEAMKEALRDERSFSEDTYSDAAFEKQKVSPTFRPELWTIAWAGDRIVGGVHNFVDETENREFGRKWGHTERIFVSRGWRKKGVASALIATSLRVLKDIGMEQATLDVDTENPSGALRLYKSLGYREEMHFSFYSKPFD